MGQFTREAKLELLERSLGLKHKLKVHDSMRMPDTHEDMAVMMLAKWEFEDEISAIDELLVEARQEAVREKKDFVRKQVAKGLPAKGGTSKKKSER